MTTKHSPWHEAETHLAARDPVLAAIISSYGPCALRPKKDYFAVLCESIVSQQLAVKAADAIHDRFTAYYGGEPTPDKLAATPPEKLRELGLSGRKAEYMLDLADRFRRDAITPAAFAAMPDGEIIDQLISVKGIGVWTAHMFLIFALNRPDVLPVGDYGVRKAFMLSYALDALPGAKLMENIAAPWRPWRSIASWYLWRSLENK
ncbi:DNA-3-methyladenine glycosylase family protein [Anaeroselena agilis]|uniref:DNA-3-methyladenine glycosylase II n=1 Tax=Anaeroselena agilis TaxID=3063788 RepID=A0ABU3NVC7_9FIRM|nr:DNA-3-methyladenine glycosylase [Selenomonadales bacterium 4137-cl]